MAGNRKPKRKPRKVARGKAMPAAQAKKPVTNRKSPADAGNVWPYIQPPQLSVPMALQFSFQVSEWWPQERLLENQMRQISALLSHAATTVPYYMHKLRQYPSTSLSKMTMSMFQELPLLRRTDIQNAGRKLVSNAVPGNHGEVFEVRSSGSTGHPIRVMGTDHATMFQRAIGMRGHLWHQRDLSAKSVEIRTARRAGKPSRNLRWNYVPDGGEAVNLDINLPISVLLDQLVAEDPVYLQTHPYTLKGLVENSFEREIRPRSLREVRAFGEVLEPEIRDAARLHWGVAVVDNYSAMEIGPMAKQCPECENLHVQSESVLIEILDEEGSPCLPGESGRVVVTTLHNFATPLIRYEIGDYAEVGEACTCGRGLPVLTRILGRQRNFLLLPNGEKLFPEARKALTDSTPEIRQFQLTQKTVDAIEVKLVVSEPLVQSKETQLAQALTDKFGYAFDYRFVYVDDIPRHANGKFEEFISEVL